MTTKTTSPKKLVAELCLYGNNEVGFGFLLATHHDAKPHGDPDPKVARGLTDCMMQAAWELNRLGVHHGILRVHAPGGEACAEVDLDRCMPSYGDLKWGPAPVVTISSEKVVTAATEIS